MSEVFSAEELAAAGRARDAEQRRDALLYLAIMAVLAMGLSGFEPAVYLSAAVLVLGPIALAIKAFAAGVAQGLDDMDLGGSSASPPQDPPPTGG